MECIHAARRNNFAAGVDRETHKLHRFGRGKCTKVAVSVQVVRSNCTIQTSRQNHRSIGKCYGRNGCSVSLLHGHITKTRCGIPQFELAILSPSTYNHTVGGIGHTFHSVGMPPLLEHIGLRAPLPDKYLYRTRVGDENIPTWGSCEIKLKIQKLHQINPTHRVQPALPPTPVIVDSLPG